MDTVSTKLAALKVNLDKRTKLDTTTPFPLKSLLTIYLKLPPDLVYNNYFEGFKLLRDWLSPIEIPECSYPAIHRALLTYEMQEIAKHMGVSQALIHYLILEILNERRDRPKD